MSVIHSGDGSRTCVFGLQRQSWCGIKSKNTYMREGCINTDHSIGKFPKKKTKTRLRAKDSGIATKARSKL